MQVAAAKRKELDDSDAFEGLTSKQHRFVMHSFSGLSDVAAYRLVYDCRGMNPVVTAHKAAELAHDPLVSAKLRDLRLQVEEQSTLAPTTTRAFVLNGITALALNADKDSTKLRAYELLGKTAGIDLFRDTVRHERTERSVEDVDKELRDRLRELQSTIEGTALEVPSNPSPEERRDRRRKPKP